MSDNFIIYLVMNFLSIEAFLFYFFVGLLSVTFGGIWMLSLREVNGPKYLFLMAATLITIGSVFLVCFLILPNQKTGLLIIKTSHPELVEKIDNNSSKVRRNLND